MIYRFTEVLNDLVNYFLLGDILLLEDWKQANHLSDDLAMKNGKNELLTYRTASMPGKPWSSFLQWAL